MTAPSRTGMISTHELHYTWNGIFLRCYYPSINSYNVYGGRGIKVCKRWRDFRLFLQDMGPRPKGYQLDRINPNGDYKPSNCRWVTTAEQARNKRNKV